MAHALPEYTARNQIKFEYKLYKLRGLIGVTNNNNNNDNKNNN